MLINIDGTLVNTEYFTVSFGQSADINKIVAIMLKGPINLFKQPDLMLQQSRHQATIGGEKCILLRYIVKIDTNVLVFFSIIVSLYNYLMKDI